MIKARSAFYCTICDFKNHFYFNSKQKKVTIDHSTCGAIAENTINFTYMIHLKIAPLMLKLNRIFKLFGDAIPQTRINRFREVFAATKKCALSFVGDTNSSSGKACASYCKFYHINSTSAVQEGYEVFFTNVLNQLEAYFKYFGVDWKTLLEDETQGKGRILA